MTVDEVVEDIMLASLCGVPPYSPDSLIDVFVDEDMVVAEVPSLFHQPLRLNTAELFALITMGRAALSVTDEPGPLASALDKLRPLLPESAGTIAVEVAEVAHLDALRRALEGSAKVEIDYFAPASGSRTTRMIVPRRIFDRLGHWYVSADDERSGEVREFRVDRIEALRETGEVASPREDVEAREWFADAVDRVTLRVAPEARWLVEPYPAVDKVLRADGSIDITLAVSSPEWLGRLLVRGGRSIAVVSGDRAHGVREQMARRIRARYTR